MRGKYEWFTTYYARKAVEANPELSVVYGRLGRFNHWKNTNLKMNLKMNLNECCLQCGSCTGCECSD
jgi:hypothetical protein